MIQVTSDPGGIWTVVEGDAIAYQGNSKPRVIAAILDGLDRMGIPKIDTLIENLGSAHEKGKKGTPKGKKRGKK